MEGSAREWISRFAAEIGVEPPDEAMVERLLELAGMAAHSSERIAAPIACWMTGIAGVSVEEAIVAARAVGDVR
jgi:hypothetical protein